MQTNGIACHPVAAGAHSNLKYDFKDIVNSLVCEICDKRGPNTSASTATTSPRARSVASISSKVQK